MLRCEPVVAHVAAHGEPVALLDVGLVVLAVAAATGEGDLFSPSPLDEGVVDELRAVVGVQALEREREPSTDMVHGGAYPLLAPAPDRLQLRPAGSDIDGAERGEVEALGTFATVQDEVGLQSAHGHVPPLAPGTDSHLALEPTGNRPSAVRPYAQTPPTRSAPGSGVLFRRTRHWLW